MRIGYWDCFSGIAGDMNLGAMVGCGLEVDGLREDLAGLALEGFRIEHRRVRRGALAADKIDVVIAAEGAGHAHRGLADIREILAASSLPSGVAERADEVFVALCGAEASVHGCGIDEVHLHEVGAIDAIVDVVGACCGMRRLGVEAFYCSPLNVGAGTVSTAHGVLPVPAPATALLLRQAPVYSSGPEAELVTPTGAALVAVLSEGFGRWPAMKVDAVGYGAGDNEFGELANVLRLAVGEADAAGERDEAAGPRAAGVSVIETNLDDCDPRIVGELVPRLIEAGALDAFTTPVHMKKNRPGIQLTVIAADPDVDVVADMVLRETTTLGLRIHGVERRELARRHVEVETPFGAVRIKVGMMGDEVVNAAPEFEDCRRCAHAAGVTVKRVMQAAVAAYAGRSESEENGT